MQSVYYKKLGSYRYIYDRTLQAFQNREKSFWIVENGLNHELIFEVMYEVLREHPEIFDVTNQEIRSMTSSIRFDIMPIYAYSSQETIRISNQLNKIAQKIIRENINDHQSDYDKVLVLHDYLTTNLEYDLVAFEYDLAAKKEPSAVDSRKPNERYLLEAHNVIGALLNKKCVCEGFAKAFKYLCDKIGIECWVVHGEVINSKFNGPHAWNIVKISGHYHHIDVTWDCNVFDSSNIPKYFYMNLSDKEIAKDHSWDPNHYPECSNSPYNYFRVNNALLDSKEQLESLLFHSFLKKEKFIWFIVVKGSVLERKIKDCLRFCMHRAAKRCNNVSSRTITYYTIRDQLIYLIESNYFK